MGLEGIHVLEHPLKRRGGLAHRPQTHVKARTFPAQTFRKGRAKTLVQEPALSAYVALRLDMHGRWAGSQSCD